MHPHSHHFESRSKRRTQVLVAVLAGGRGERLGGRKPSVTLAGRPLIAYPLAAAQAAELDAVVVAKPDSQLPPLAERVIYDVDERRHPLSGVVTALSEAPNVIAIACDMPFVPPDLLRWIAEQQADAVVMQSGDFIDPFPALYSRRHLQSLTAAVHSEASLRATLARLQPQILHGRDLRAFGSRTRISFSVNTREDLAAAERWLRAFPQLKAPTTGR